MRRRSLSLSLAALGWTAAVGCVDRGEVLAPATHEDGSNETGGAAGTPETAGASGSVTPNAVINFVSLGPAHSLALASDRLFAWGANESGELGQNDTLERHSPTELVSDLRFAAVAGGGDSGAHGFSCALDELGAAYCWGTNERGQLAQGDRDERHVPTPVALPVAALRITTDFEHVCALLADARLFCWGRNQEGELGQNDSVPPSNDDTARDALTPVQVPGNDWSSVDAGDGHTCGIRLDGSLWCWGRNTGHQLGTSDEPQIRQPIQVGTDTDWLRVESGQQHSIALKRDHSLWGWGLNEASSTGEGYPLALDADEVDAPTRIGSASDWASISTRVFHSCAVNRDNELWCWGRNTEGQLGTGDTTLRKQPTLVATGIADVDVSWFVTCAITQGGALECTGANDHGQLGTGTTDRPLQFTDITPPFE